MNSRETLVFSRKEIKWKKKVELQPAANNKLIKSLLLLDLRVLNRKHERDLKTVLCLTSTTPIRLMNVVLCCSLSLNGSAVICFNYVINCDLFINTEYIHNLSDCLTHSRKNESRNDVCALELTE